jgi:hypothetical protein
MPLPKEGIVTKFILTFGGQGYRLLVSEAAKKGITIQQLLRAVIIPEWLRDNEAPRETLRPFRFDQTSHAGRAVRTH